MAMYMCPNCGKGVSSTEIHKCPKNPIVLNILSTKESEKNTPFFNGYKSKLYFNTDDK